jgi:hypothetical protein
MTCYPLRYFQITGSPISRICAFGDPAGPEVFVLVFLAWRVLFEGDAILLSP